MIERKRRNDFVRKREFDMLRKVRREGLTQRAAGRARRLVAHRRLRGPPAGKRGQGRQRREGEDRRDRAADGRRQLSAPPQRRPPTLLRTRRRSPQPLGAPAAKAGATESGVAEPAAPSAAAAPAAASARTWSMRPRLRPQCRSKRSVRRKRRCPLRNWRRVGLLRQSFAVEVNEVAHDPDLDEAVIAFANADFEQCEQSLGRLTGARRHARAARRDLARAVRPVSRDRPAAQVRKPGARLRAAVRLVGAAVVLDAQAGGRGGRRGAAGRSARRSTAQVGWVCPELVDADAVARLRSQTLQMPLPWVFDWSALRAIDAEACARTERAVPHWVDRGPRHALAVRRDAVQRAAGSRAHRRARRRPGVTG